MSSWGSSMIPAISLKSTIRCSGWQLAGAAISKTSFDVPISPPCWGALKDIAGKNQGLINRMLNIRNQSLDLKHSLFDLPANKILATSLYSWEHCVEFYLVTQAIVKCWDRPRIPDLFQGLAEGPVQGPEHQNLIRDRESKFITYVHRCFVS